MQASLAVQDDIIALLGYLVAFVEAASCENKYQTETLILDRLDSRNHRFGA
jgi:hypothetical protein